MRFKNGLNYRVTPFKEYEIELPWDEVMYKLEQQAQICRDEDSNGVELQFTYYNDGDFILNDCTRDGRQSFLQGEILDQNGKTAIKVMKVERKGYFVASIISAILILIIFIICLCFMLASAKDVPTTEWLKLSVLPLIFVFSIDRSIKEKNMAPLDEEIMLREIERRINGVIRWDE